MTYVTVYHMKIYLFSSISKKESTIIEQRPSTCVIFVYNLVEFISIWSNKKKRKRVSGQTFISYAQYRNTSKGFGSKKNIGPKVNHKYACIDLAEMRRLNGALTNVWSEVFVACIGSICIS